MRRSLCLIIVGFMILSASMILFSGSVEAQNDLSPTFTFEYDSILQGVGWSADGTTILIWDRNNVYLRDAETGDEIWQLETPYSGLGGVWLSQDGKRLMTNSYDDFRVTVWDVETQEILIDVNDVFQTSQFAWTQSGRYLATNVYGEWQVWDIDSPAEPILTTVEGNRAVFSPDESRIVFLGQNSTIWNLENPDDAPVSFEITPPPYYGKWSDDGQLIALLIPNALQIVDSQSGELVYQLPTEALQGDVEIFWGVDNTNLFISTSDTIDYHIGIDQDALSVYEDDITAIGRRISPDSAYRINVDDDDQIVIWDVQGQSVLYPFAVDVVPTRVAWSADSQLLAFYNDRDQLMLYSIEQNAVVFGGDLLTRRFPSTLLWHPSESLLITRSENMVEVWDFGNAELAPLEEDTALLGEELFEELNCGGCHLTGGGGAGPDLTGIMGQKRTRHDSSVVIVDENFIRESIIDPDAVILEYYPKDVEPDYYGEILDDAALDALVNYVISISE